MFAQPCAQGRSLALCTPSRPLPRLRRGSPACPGPRLSLEAEERTGLFNHAGAGLTRPSHLTSGTAEQALYHLSAVTMGNLTGLAATAAQLWEQLGYSRDDGIQAVVAMMRSVVTISSGRAFGGGGRALCAG